MQLTESTSTTREALLNALYSSACEVPAWASFAHFAQRIFTVDQVAVIVSADPAEPVVTRADDSHATAIEALTARLSEVPEKGEPRILEMADGIALAMTVKAAQHRASVILWRADARSGFSSEQTRILNSLADALRRSLDIYHRCADLVRRASMNEVALETSRIGAALVGIDGELLLANSVAEELLAQGEGLYLSHRRLYARNPAEGADLMAEIRRCALNQSAAGDPQNYVPLAFGRLSHSLPLTVIVRPGPAFHPLPRPLRRTAILLMRDPMSQAAWPAETLSRLFGLTAAEAQLASKLARGASLEEAAGALGISRNTARTQLQAIFMKTGLNRQTELMRALFNSAATSA